MQAGAGEPVVLMHGVGLRAESLGRQFDALARRYAVSAIDLPGHGASAAFDDVHSLADYTDRVAAFVGELDTPALFLGHSMGAMVAMDFAVRFPGRCRAIAALNAIYRRSSEAASAVRARAAALDGRGPADAAPTLRRWFGEDMLGDAALACRRWLGEVDPRAYRRAYAVFAQHDGADDADLARLSCPVLFMTGGDEPNSTPAMSRALAALVPRGEAVVVEGAAHMMPMTHAQAVNEAVVDFFARCREVNA